MPKFVCGLSAVELVDNFAWTICLENHYLFSPCNYDYLIVQNSNLLLLCKPQILRLFLYMQQREQQGFVFIHL